MSWDEDAAVPSGSVLLWAWGARARAARLRRGADHARARPEHPSADFFDPGRRRQPGALPASLLVLRPPADLRHSILPAMGIVSEESSPCVCRASRCLTATGAVVVATAVIGRLPDVSLAWGEACSRSASATGSRRASSCSTRPRARGADRREDLQLAGDALARQPALRHGDAVRARLPLRLHDRRPLRDLPGRVPVDWQVHDTYYVVAHLHYVLFGGSILGILCGLYYWWPKFFGRVLDERLGKLKLLAHRLGFNLTFFPQHMLGLLGMPRRIYTYEDTAPAAGVQPDLDDRLLRDGPRDPRLRLERDQVAARHAARATTRGSPTRSSGTRPRRRRRTTSTPSPT